MKLVDILEQITDLLKNKWGEFQESSLYIQFKQKYDDLSPFMQKGVNLTFILFVLLFLVLLPWSWIDSSSSFIESFESKKAVIRNLLQLKRDIAEQPQTPNGIPSSNLKSQVETTIRSMGLTTDQIKGVEEITITPESTSSLVPASVTQSGVQLTIWKINLEQFIDLSYKIQRLNPSTKLLSVDMKANNEDNHYYDVIYQLISFSVPQASVSE